MTLKERADALKANSYALYLASKDERLSPWVKFLILAIIAYLLSPIDLIPDFIPVIGYLDDLLLLPLAIALVIRLIPDDLWLECREKATKSLAMHSAYSRLIAAIIVLIWAALLIWLGQAAWLWMQSGTG